MIYYVIKIVHSWTNKDGTAHTLESYYEKTTSFLFPLNHLCSLKGAKQFDCKSEAKRIGLRVFGNRKFEVIKINNEL